MKNEFKKIFQIIAIVILFFAGQNVYAEGETINLTIKKEGKEVLSLNIPLPPEGMININDSGGSQQEVEGRSVLNIIYDADDTSPEFNISELTYYPSFGAFYLKCITVDGDELCDNWQYKVDGETPGTGMDGKILSGGESVILFFGEENLPEPEPEPDPVEEETRKSSGSSRTRPRVSTTVVAQDPVLEVPPEVTALVISEPVSPIVVAPTVPEKKEPATPKPEPKKIATLGDIASKNTATVIEVETITEIEQPPTPPEKDSWFKTILKWLFNF